MPSLLFNPNTFGRIAQFLLFWFFAAALGKKTSVPATVLVIAGIVAFNLLAPYGRVLASFGAFRITEGALLAGIRRAVTLEGLIMLSKAGVRQDLRLPGAFGGLLGESLRIFAALTGRKRRLSPKSLVADIDAILFELSAADEPLPPHTDAAQKTSASGMVILAAAVLASWGTFAAGTLLSDP
jgi:heptaprenyl diphosphate synthase